MRFRVTERPDKIRDRVAGSIAIWGWVSNFLESLAERAYVRTAVARLANAFGNMINQKRDRTVPACGGRAARVYTPRRYSRQSREARRRMMKQVNRSIYEGTGGRRKDPGVLGRSRRGSSNEHTEDRAQCSPVGVNC